MIPDLLHFRGAAGNLEIASPLPDVVGNNSRRGIWIIWRLLPTHGSPVAAVLLLRRDRGSLEGLGHLGLVEVRRQGREGGVLIRLEVEVLVREAVHHREAQHLSIKLHVDGPKLAAVEQLQGHAWRGADHGRCHHRSVGHPLHHEGGIDEHLVGQRPLDAVHVGQVGRDSGDVYHQAARVVGGVTHRDLGGWDHGEVGKGEAKLVHHHVAVALECSLGEAVNPYHCHD
mmetsp:Transcript_13042/g.33486  ORF Transcript_13042/g.33486 Transcript_13042/m.33486 type:complete len:228 (-) Transcript_13042:1621-2304(-)